MNINRHNYETLFLLYVDNELSASERKAVELFVQENPDLGNELVSLLETTLPEETIGFGGKEGLYKSEINQDLQENLLLHLDNELTPAAAAKMNAMIAADAVINNEWKILQQTKLDSNEEIIFENKDVLYRKEKGRVVAIRFWRMAAAAAILLFCLFIGISLLKKNDAAEHKLVKTTDKPVIEKQELNNNNNASNNSSFDSSKITVPENIASVEDDIKTDKANDNNKLIPVSPDEQRVSQQQNNVASVDKTSNQKKNISAEVPLENINKQESNKTIASAVINKNNKSVITNQAPDEMVKKSVKEKISAPSAPLIDYNSVSAMPDSYAKTTVLSEAAPVNENKIFYMSEDVVTKSKVGGLLRRLKRTIERNANINTGNGVRIAGFEIAVK